MINLQNVTFGYNGTAGHMVFTDLSLSIEAGHIYGLLGKNGVGKSTLFRLITGVNPATSGTVETMGFSPFERDPKMLSEIYMIPEALPEPPMSIAKFAELYGVFYPRFDLERMMTFLSTFEVDPNQKISSMSLGQRKKAMIAFGLSTNTQILLMDEPTNGLDIPSKRMFRDCLEQIKSPDRVIMISTHLVRDLEELIDAVIVVHDTNVALCDTVKNLTAKYHFGEIQTPENAIYSERVGANYYGVTVVKEGEQPDKRLDLEVLFNAAISKCI